MALYNMKSKDDKFIITKFDDDLNPEASYQIDKNICTCPAGVHDRHCKHREMFIAFMNTVRWNSHWFINYDTGEWVNFQPQPKWRRI